ncbi:uncharacterized protein TRUGW13939_02459 [Talaromyces rugulosus]|uniref:Alcohol dehydrogenase-like N-terminal domain-containing protein n=1 Tax=Talaromyces rugulosus TaxID=121627 RepID=A0A7H8QN37_TALRU|nr:uncharacterized protein TRUGW13939_02459 [Talaromyces rugulosus]QKX55367.1 hypothetical protein TRUGW13939_02459 [Talaromyces rugulosus]
MNGLPTSQQALKLGADEVLVRVACVALNPYDAKSVDMSPSPGATAGVDFAGEVVALGEGADSSSSRLALGKRVCGCVFGNNPDRRDNGAYAEYVAVPASLVLCIPDSMTFPEAATLPSGMATTGGAFYNGLNVPTQLQPPPTAGRGGDL